MLSCLPWFFAINDRQDVPPPYEPFSEQLVEPDLLSTWRNNYENAIIRQKEQRQPLTEFLVREAVDIMSAVSEDAGDSVEFTITAGGIAVTGNYGFTTPFPTHFLKWIIESGAEVLEDELQRVLGITVRVDFQRDQFHFLRFTLCVPKGE